MEAFPLRAKGQASIEFMLILVILLIFLQTMILPTVTVSLHSVEDVARLGQTSFAAKKLANAIQNIQLMPGNASQQISLFVPDCGTTKCNVSCTGSTISFTSPLSQDLNEHLSCPGKICTKTINVTTSGTLTCNLNLDGPISREVTIVLNKAGGIGNVTVS